MASQRVTRSQRAMLTGSLPGPVVGREARGGSLPNSGQVGQLGLDPFLMVTEQVTQGREREREAGGPAVPHNSLDLSAIDLSETRAEATGDTPEVFQEDEAELAPLSLEPSSLHRARMMQQDMHIQDLLRRMQFLRRSRMQDIRTRTLDIPQLARRELTPTRAQQLDSTIDLTESPPPSSPEVRYSFADLENACWLDLADKGICLTYDPELSPAPKSWETSQIREISENSTGFLCYFQNT